MSQKYKVDFATFCHPGDAHRLHALGQLKRQVVSNSYNFNQVIVVHQIFRPKPSRFPDWDDNNLSLYVFHDLSEFDSLLQKFDVDLSGQYVSSIDKAHYWKVHVINHLAAVSISDSDFIVFADNDCWMVDQPAGLSWVDRATMILNDNPQIFIVSPNDGEPGRVTKRFSQQMFVARTEEFRNFDFNQPGWDGNVNIPGGPMPEYWAMLEGRMELGCRITGQQRYVLGPEYRYWHHNILNEDDLFELDRSKY